jgi:hypothetical protein
MQVYAYFAVRADHDEVEAIILLPDRAAVEAFRRGEGVLEDPRAHDSASSVTDGNARPMQLKAYGIDEDVVFDMPLTGQSTLLFSPLFLLQRYLLCLLRSHCCTAVTRA